MRPTSSRFWPDWTSSLKDLRRSTLRRHRSDTREDNAYIATSGATMPNRGETDTFFRNEEGHQCMLKMQMADAQKQPISISRICDPGHRVVFNKKCGPTQNETTGQTTVFYRDPNAYRMATEVVDPRPSIFPNMGRFQFGVGHRFTTFALRWADFVDFHQIRPVSTRSG